MLVHEVLYEPAIVRLVIKTKNGATLKKHLMDSHTNVGRIAAAASVKTLVLSHFVPGDDPLVTKDNWTDGTSPAKIVVARNLMELALPV